MYLASRFSISLAFGPGRVVFISGRVVLVIVCIKPPRTVEQNETFIAGYVPAHRAWLMEGWSVREKVSADRAGGAYGCVSHLGHLPFRVLKSQHGWRWASIIRSGWTR